VAEALDEGIEGVDRLIAELDLSGLLSIATYLGNDGYDLFTVTRLKEEGISPAFVMVAIGVVEREFREIKRWTEVGVRWSDDGVERVARLLEEVWLNGLRLGFQGTCDECGG
jgi:hypothetical protein